MRREGTVLLAALAAIPLLALGCRKGGADAPTGSARVVVQPLVAEEAIARLTVTVSSGPSAPGFDPIVAGLTRGASLWNGGPFPIPAGRQRQFDAIAFDAQGRQLFAAAAHADIAAGVETVVAITLDDRPPAQYQNAFPVIDAVSWAPSAPAPSTPVRLAVTAHDPDAGDALRYAWTASCGAFDAATVRTPVWTAPAEGATCHLSVAVTDGHAATTGFDFDVPVGAAAGGAEVVITTNAWPVIASLGGALYLRDPTLEADLAVQASDPDGDAVSYTWESDCAGVAFVLSPPYSARTPHLSLPAASAPCSVTVDVFDGVAPRPTTGTLHLSREAVVLNCQNVSCPAGQRCDPASGGCSPAGSCTASCAGRACGPDGCGGSCGTCPGAQGCGAEGQCVPVCVPACGGKACGDDGCGGSCGPCGAGAACSAAGQCVSTCTPSCAGRACGPDGCGGSCGTCAAGTCSAGGQCLAPASVVAPFAAHELVLSPAADVAVDAAGAAFVAGTLSSGAPVDFQTRAGGAPLTLATTGTQGSDIFVARYDASGEVAWARGIGDDDGTSTNDQTATGIAVDGRGTVAIIGKIAGDVTFGASPTVSSASGLWYVAGLSGADGSRRWGAGYNLGSNGALAHVASSPIGAAGRFAVCGQANRAATTLVPGATYGGLQDAVLAVFDDAGTRLWAVQVGGAGNESCTAVAVDDAGDVLVAGQFDGASLAVSAPGASAPAFTLAGPGTTARKFLWVAKYSGASGTPLAAVAYSGPSGAVLPLAASAGAAGTLYLGGSFSGAPAFGGSTITSAGGDDAFVLALDGATLAPVVAPVRVGGTGNDAVRGLGVTSAGDVVATGAIRPSTSAFRAANGHDTTGVAGLDVDGTASPDQLVVQLDGTTLATRFAALYGDAGTQGGDALAVGRGAGGGPVVLTGTLTGSATFGAAGTVSATSVGGVTGVEVSLVFARLQ